MTLTYFMILDGTGNLVDSFDEEAEARAALDDITHADAEHAEDYAILPYDEHGHVIGEPIQGARLGTHA